MSTNITSVSAKVNGTVYDGFVYNSSTGYWEKELTAPQQSSRRNGGYYPVEVTATDEAGNTKTATVSDFDTLKLVVRETDPPIIELSGIAAGSTTSNAKPTINIIVEDYGAGISNANFLVIVDGTEKSLTLSLIDDCQATGNFTPSEALSDGEHTITVRAYDDDDNCAESSVTFRVLTSYPSLTVSSPSAEETILNTQNITVVGNTNTDTGNVINITVNDEDQGEVTVDSSGNFSKSITLPTDGTYTILVKATNSANLSTTVSRTIILDTTEPVFKSVEINPNPVNTSTTYVIRVKVE